jgi:geranylgeranylglycerol-phosphate geranylgeranyltransferase
MRTPRPARPGRAGLFLPWARFVSPGGNLILLDYLFLARPVLVAVVWIFPLLGARGAGDPVRLALLLGEVAALAGAAFVHNQLHDREGDRANRKCESLARGLVTARGARIWLLLLLACGMACAALLGVAHLAAALGFFLLAAVGYNLPPLRAKDHPVRSLLLAAPAFGLLVLQGASLNPGFQGSAALLQTLPVVLAGLSLSLLATVPDLPGDQLAGKRTWAVVHGELSAWRVATGLMAAAGMAAVLGGDFQVGLPALVAMVWMIASQVRPRRDALAVLRGSAGLQALALAASWPRICLGVLAFLLLARVYYQRRFQLDYPSLGRERT